MVVSGHVIGNALDSDCLESEYISYRVNIISLVEWTGSDNEFLKGLFDIFWLIMVIHDPAWVSPKIQMHDSSPKLPKMIMKLLKAIRIHVND